MSQQDNYEAVVAEAASEVAEFHDEKRGVLGTIQHALHTNPALVPLIVLIASIIIFCTRTEQRIYR